MTDRLTDLHDALGRYPADRPPATLIQDLDAASAVFAELWRARPVKPRVASRKTFLHPEIGTMTLDCDVLVVHDSDLRLVIYMPVISSPDADSKALLSAVGLHAAWDDPRPAYVASVPLSALSAAAAAVSVVCLVIW